MTALSDSKFLYTIQSISYYWELTEFCRLHYYVFCSTCHRIQYLIFELHKNKFNALFAPSQKSIYFLFMC